MAEITDAELDEWETLAAGDTSPWYKTALVLIKALRACRLDADVKIFKLSGRIGHLLYQAKAKDAVVEALGGVTPQETMHAIAWLAGVQSNYAREGVTEQAAQLLSTADKCLRVLDKALAALPAKQGERDDE